MTLNLTWQGAVRGRMHVVASTVLLHETKTHTINQVAVAETCRAKMINQQLSESVDWQFVREIKKIY